MGLGRRLILCIKCYFMCYANNNQNKTIFLCIRNNSSINVKSLLQLAKQKTGLVNKEIIKLKMLL